MGKGPHIPGKVGIDEADRCPYCDCILRDPPDCCKEMIEEDARETEEFLEKYKIEENPQEEKKND